ADPGIDAFLQHRGGGGPAGGGAGRPAAPATWKNAVTERLPLSYSCAYLMAPGRVEVREVPLARPQAGQGLLRVECALAGGTDRKAFVRGHPEIPMPGPFGHRYAGTVAALGKGAPPFAVGQPVMGVHSAPCLKCDLCTKGRPHLCPDVMREKVLGAFG